MIENKLKAEEIINTILVWYDFRPDQMSNRHSLVERIAEIIARKCNHPTNKVSKKTVMAGDFEPRQIFECSCGAKVEPASFVQVPARTEGEKK